VVLSGGPHPVVLVDGEDAALVAEFVSRVISELVGDSDRGLAVEDDGGEEVDLAAVADRCATPPFLVERRVVVVRDVGRFTADQVAPLLAYLDDPLPSTALVLVAGGSGKTPAKLMTAVRSKGEVISAMVAGRQSGDWLRAQVRQSAVSLDPAAMSRVADHLGEDLARLTPLLEVLRAVYGDEAKLGPDDVEPYLGEAGAVTPWAFTDAIDTGQTAAALTMLHRLLEGGGRHPLVVLAILHRHVQSLLRVDGPAIRTEAQAAEAMGIARGRSTYPAKKALTAARRWGPAGIADAVGLIADAELDLKGASSWPPEAVLEVLVARLCRLARAGSGASAGRS
jgi:DNA polymerase-3 subunit delta